MRAQLQQLLDARVKQCVGKKQERDIPCQKIKRKLECMERRNAEIVKAKANGRIARKESRGENEHVYYSVHFQYLIKQKDFMYIEEEIEERKAVFYRGQIVEDVELSLPVFELGTETRLKFLPAEEGKDDGRLPYTYNRLKAVQYAERWWNSYNPAYIKFENDCTNFISQCLHQGGAPMRGYPNRTIGWWLRGKNYSWSWAVANALKVYLETSKTGLRAREVNSPDQLLLGDVICYDFQGNGRFDHNTIVTGKDANGMPLVNAHTYNSRQRYWAYEDSSAYTPNIQYKFFSIVDDS
jgi:hypothetical protein